MPLPGFNPMEAAPPPGSTEVAASAAQAARLHQRISDLERRLSTMETGRGTGWTAFTPTYTSPYVAFSADYAPTYMIANNIVYLGGLVKPSAGAGGVIAITLPAFLWPEATISSAPNQAQFFAVSYHNGAAYVTATVYVYPRQHPTVGNRGVLSIAPGVPAGGYFGLWGIYYRKRTDM